MIHALGCSCYNCKNGYTPLTDRVDYLLRDWRKPTGKRPTRTKIIKKIKEKLSRAEGQELHTQYNHLKDI